MALRGKSDGGREHNISASCISRGVLLWISSALEDQSLGLDVGGWSAFGVLWHVSPSLASSERSSRLHPPRSPCDVN